jgi:ubiquinone/menaquinone biosynthesis C-methylase UbiE
LKFTGERLTTEINPNYGIIEHLHRYAIAQEFTKNKIVLDIACGEGYGTNLISQNAKFVFGVDISPDAINNASKKYAKSNIEFLIGNATSLTIDSKTIDVVISFETLEHINQQDDMLKEFKRVLRTDGILIISTPNKEIYYKREPHNPYHLKELNDLDFRKLILNHFRNIRIFKQKFCIGSIIENQDEKLKMDSYYGDFNTLNKNTECNNLFFNNYFFNIAVASDGLIPSLNNSIFDGSDIHEQIVEKEINNFTNDIGYQFNIFIKFPFKLLKQLVKIIKKLIG